MKRLHGFSVLGCVAMVAGFGTSAAGSSPALLEVPFECGVTSNNDGCEKTVSCPEGTKLRAAKAACNLEYGSVTDDQLAPVEQGYIEVVRSSDHVDEGRCWVGSAEVDDGTVEIAALSGRSGVSIGCQEYDRNGADCQIRGSLYCE